MCCLFLHSNMANSYERTTRSKRYYFQNGFLRVETNEVPPMHVDFEFHRIRRRRRSPEEIEAARQLREAELHERREQEAERQRQMDDQRQKQFQEAAHRLMESDLQQRREREAERQHLLDTQREQQIREAAAVLIAVRHADMRDASTNMIDDNNGFVENCDPDFEWLPDVPSAEVEGTHDIKLRFNCHLPNTIMTIKMYL